MCNKGELSYIHVNDWTCSKVLKADSKAWEYSEASVIFFKHSSCLFSGVGYKVCVVLRYSILKQARLNYQGGEAAR